MAFDIKGYRIFMASPSGLEEEQRAFYNAVKKYNIEEAIPRDVMFKAVGWKETIGGIGKPQSLINDEVKKCDYFILVLHNHWGSIPSVDASNTAAGTEEEYLLALECIQKDEFPMKQLICLFKAVEPEQMADPEEQLQKVIDFKRELQNEKKRVFSSFSSMDEFSALIRENLTIWLRNGDSIDLGGIYNSYTAVNKIPLNRIKQSKSEDRSHMKSDAELHIENAWGFANEEKIVDAELEFCKAIVADSSGSQLKEYAMFLLKIGQLDKAMTMINESIKLAENNSDFDFQAGSYSAMGLILETRGDLNGAKEMHEKSLEINEKLGRVEGIAEEYGNLGNVFHTNGDLDRAEEMYKKALEIHRELGRQEEMKNQYENLGIVLYTRGDLDGAEKMYRKGLEINENLGRLEGVANQYSHLGVVFHARVDLDNAEEMYKKSLELYEKLGSQEGMANQYEYLGIVYFTREDLDSAEEMYRKALELNKKLGQLDGMANQYGSLGNILKIHGDLDGAEEMYKKGLEIDEKLGRLVGLSSDYGHLGLAYQERGELDEAVEMFKKTLEVNGKLGRLEGMAADYGNIGVVFHTRGDLDGAEEMYMKSKEIAERFGYNQILDIVSGQMEKLRMLRGGE